MGIRTNTTLSSFDTRFARSYIPNWENKSLNTAISYSDKETDTNLASFVPMRTKQMGGLQGAITPGTDMWEANPDASDNKIGDFYFRITIPSSQAGLKGEGE